MESKKIARLRRSLQTRKRAHLAKKVRLSVNRTNLHIYATVYSGDGSKVLATASTLDSEVKSKLSNGSTSDKSAAKVVGDMVAKRAINAGVHEVTFDRSGFAYHGRVKELAESAREAGLKF